MRLTGAEIVLECLLEQGVDTVFGFPGGTVLHIYDALYKYQDKIQHILTCHEQHAAHAADGYARSTGRPGVVIATSGPGATNLITGIANAYMDSVPLIAITANVPVHMLGRDSFQEVDITGITMPITKHNYIIRDIADMADIFRSAFKIATSGRPGPVLIDIPKDMTQAVWDFEPKKPDPVAPFTESILESDIEEALKLIAQCEKPLILAGGGVISSSASEELSAFRTRLDAPLALSLMGIGAFPSTDPNYTGMIGMHGTKASSFAVSHCDLLIAIGTRFSDRVICNPKHFAPNAKIVHIDVDPAEINKNIRAYRSIIGDVKEVLKQLNTRVLPRKHDDWNAQIQDYKMRFPIDHPKGEEVMPQMIFEKAWEIIGDRAIITTEVGQHQMWAAQFLKMQKPRTFITSGGLGAMGFGLGAAIGAQMANPDKVVVNVAGDGSFHMNLMELSTAVQNDLPVKILLMNNGVLGMVRQWQRIFYDKRFSHTTLKKPTDYVKLAEAFGAEGYTISTVADIEPVLKAALTSKKAAVINCLIGLDVNVLPMVPAGQSIADPILEIKI